jgi:hypothetical protein
VTCVGTEACLGNKTVSPLQKGKIVVKYSTLVWRGESVLTGIVNNSLTWFSGMVCVRTQGGVS